MALLKKDRPAKAHVVAHHKLIFVTAHAGGEFKGVLLAGLTPENSLSCRATLGKSGVPFVHEIIGTHRLRALMTMRKHTHVNCLFDGAQPGYWNTVTLDTSYLPGERANLWAYLKRRAAALAPFINDDAFAFRVWVFDNLAAVPPSFLAAYGALSAGVGEDIATALMLYALSNKPYFLEHVEGLGLLRADDRSDAQALHVAVALQTNRDEDYKHILRCIRTHFLSYSRGHDENDARALAYRTLPEAIFNRVYGREELKPSQANPIQVVVEGVKPQAEGAKVKTKRLVYNEFLARVRAAHDDLVAEMARDHDTEIGDVVITRVSEPGKVAWSVKSTSTQTLTLEGEK